MGRHSSALIHFVSPVEGVRFSYRTPAEGGRGNLHTKQKLKRILPQIDKRISPPTLPSFVKLPIF